MLALKVAIRPVVGEDPMNSSSRLKLTCKREQVDV